MSSPGQHSNSLRKLLFSSYYTRTGRGDILLESDRLDGLYLGSRAAIEARSRAGLAHLLSTSAEHVPYYRELFVGRTITADSAPDVLAQMPILTKSLIRENEKQLKSDTPGKRVHWNTSGGSTGIPIRLRQDIRMSRSGRSFELLLMRWAGHRFGDPHVLIWGVPSETVDQRISWHERVFRFFHNETYLNCYRVSDALLDTWIEDINRLKPTLIEAYVDAIYELSKRLFTTGQRIHSPRGIITSAGVLTPEIREAIRSAFNCRILNRYGSREVGNVACSCGEADSLHVNEAMEWVEIVDDNGQRCKPGEEGDILITLLTNVTMPLIRYRIEDRGVWDESIECACGRKTKKLAQIAGRQNDYLIGRRGVRINGVALTTLLYPVQGIRQYQYRQSSTEHVDLAVVPMPGVPPERVAQQLTDLMTKLQWMMGGTPVRLLYEAEISPSNSGKYRYVVNQLPEDALRHVGLSGDFRRS
jgi:phenylacetate-CoA ligase